MSLTEEQFVEFLARYGRARSQLLDKLRIPKVLGEAPVVHTLAALTTLGVLVAVFGQIRSLTLFSFHPLFMTVGVLLCMVEGVVSYRHTTLVDVFGPIMESTKKNKARTIHLTLQMMALFFLLLGWALIIANKIVSEHIVFPLTIHAWIGTISLLYCVAQVATGFRKYEALMGHSEKRILRYHGDAGLLLFDLCCVSILLGLLSFLTISALHLMVDLSVASLWLSVHMCMYDRVTLQPRAHEDGILLDTRTHTFARAYAREEGVGESKSPRTTTM